MVSRLWRYDPEWKRWPGPPPPARLRNKRREGGGRGEGGIERRVFPAVRRLPGINGHALDSGLASQPPGLHAGPKKATLTFSSSVVWETRRCCTRTYPQPAARYSLFRRAPFLPATFFFFFFLPLLPRPIESSRIRFDTDVATRDQKLRQSIHPDTLFLAPCTFYSPYIHIVHIYIYIIYFRIYFNVYSSYIYNTF